jgi:hypothetical protein
MWWYTSTVIENRAVASQFRHDADVDTACDHQAGPRVALAMECQHRQWFILSPNYLEQSRDVCRIQWPSVFHREHVPVRLPRLLSGLSLPGLA